MLTRKPSLRHDRGSFKETSAASIDQIAALLRSISRVNLKRRTSNGDPHDSVKDVSTDRESTLYLFAPVSVFISSSTIALSAEAYRSADLSLNPGATLYETFGWA